MPGMSARPGLRANLVMPILSGSESHRRPGWCTAFQARPHRLAGRKLLLLVQIAAPGVQQMAAAY